MAIGRAMLNEERDFLSTLEPGRRAFNYMKTLITDAIGLAGFGSLAAGVYLQFGLAPSLMMSGCLLLLYALVAAMRGKNAS